MDRSPLTPEDIRGFMPGTFPGELGIEPLEIEQDHARGRIVVDRRHLHPGGYVHGGVWIAFADSVAAWGTYRHLPEGHSFTTAELKANVFAAGLPGDELVATAHPLHVGRNTAVLEVHVERVRAKERKLAAHFSVTQFVLAPRGA